MARDQMGASEVYYDLVRAGRPLKEIVAEGVRIHAPYTHVPYHERIDDGYPNFVNNDHCLLERARHAQPDRRWCRTAARCCRWRRPSGTSRPASTSGTRRSTRRPATTRAASGRPDGRRRRRRWSYWPDQEPLRSKRPAAGAAGRLDDAGASRPGDRRLPHLPRPDGEPGRAPQEVLAELVFAGLIDVQDRMLYNRSYTTGHKAYRARATVELGNAIGWDKRAPRALCRRARHRGRAALVFDLRDGLQRGEDATSRARRCTPCPTAASASRSSRMLRQQQGAADPARSRRADRRAHPRSRSPPTSST